MVKKKFKKPDPKTALVILTVRPGPCRRIIWWPRDAYRPRNRKKAPYTFATVKFSISDGVFGFTVGVDNAYAIPANQVVTAKRAWTEDHDGFWEFKIELPRSDKISDRTGA